MNKLIWGIVVVVSVMALIGTLTPLKVERDDVSASGKIEMEEVSSSFTDGTVKKFRDGYVVCYVLTVGYGGGISCFKQ